MLNVDTIDKEILDLEKRDTSYATCERLAWLYIVRDHLVKQERASKSVEAGGESHFMRTIAGKDANMVWCVVDELMDTLQVVNPRLYESVIRKLT